MRAATAASEVSASQVSVARRGPVAILSFTNPPDGTIAVKGAAQLLEQLTALLSDDRLRAVVLTGGQPGVFIRHAEVAQISRGAQALADRRIEPQSFVEGVFPRLGHAIEQADKPVIAAIEGVCMGGGFEIALCCMARVASPAATHIGLPEIRLGIFPGAGGTQRLPRLIGRHRARLFMLQGAVVDAARALELGLVDELVPNALGRAIEMAEAFARRPAGAVTAILRLTRAPPGPRFDEELTAFAILMRDDPQVRASLRAFVERDQRLHELD